MDKTYQRWALGFLALLLAVLALCAGIVYIVDPCLYYRMPENRLPAFFNERYQAAGMAKNVPADTVLLGTSMAANYRAAWIEEFYGGTGLRITIPDGYFSEFDRVVDLLFRENPPERVLFALDLNALIRDGGGVTDAMPEYLYNRNPLDDVKYLLNKDSLYYSLYALMTARQGGGQEPQKKAVGLFKAEEKFHRELSSPVSRSSTSSAARVKAAIRRRARVSWDL